MDASSSPREASREAAGEHEGEDASHASSPSCSPGNALASPSASSSGYGGDALLLDVRFNQDGGCFACAGQNGIAVYNCEPFKQQLRRGFGVAPATRHDPLGVVGGIGLVEMLFRCNLFAIVGGGEFPCFSHDKVMVWDDHQAKWIGQLGFHSKVLNVKLRRDKVCVVLRNKIFLYNFEDLKQVKQLESVDNPKGICAISAQQERGVLVCPGLQLGQIRVEYLSERRTSFIQRAHTSQLACLAVSIDGELIASASEKGTLIRVWASGSGDDTSASELRGELRRGSDRAEIFSIAFSPSKSWLAASSSKGTVHIWPLVQNNQGEGKDIQSLEHPVGVPGSGPSRLVSLVGTFIKSHVTQTLVPSYLQSRWSLAQYRLGDTSPSQVAFGSKEHRENTLMVVTNSGKFHKIQFDVSTGECKKVSFCKFD